MDKVKDNVDGSALDNLGRASAGELSRVHKGKWLTRFMFHIGTCSNMAVELFGIEKGLTLAWDYGYRQVVLETDSLEGMYMTNNSNMEAHPLHALVMNIGALLNNSSNTISYFLKNITFV